MTYRIQVRQGDSESWYWRVVAANSQTILTSETYANKGNALRAAKNFVFAIDISQLYEDEIEVDE